MKNLKNHKDMQNQTLNSLKKFASSSHMQHGAREMTHTFSYITNLILKKKRGILFRHYSSF